MRKYIHTIQSQVLDKVVENYIDYVSNPFNEWRQEIVPTMSGIIINNGEGIKAMPLDDENENLPKPRYNIARAHVIAIADIMYRCHFNTNEDENGLFTVSSRLLKAASNNYKYILDTLFRMRIIDMSKYTREGKYQKTLYSIINEEAFHPQLVASLNKDTRSIVQTLEDYYEKVRQERLKELTKKLPQQFIERYNKCLSKLKISNKEATDYINTTYPDKQDSSGKARLRTIQKIASKDYIKEIRSIDNNGRIYHIGTELQRNIKQFTNIEFSIDCKNSHPFLLSYILLNYIIKGEVDIEEEFIDKEYHFLLYNIMRYIIDNKGYYNHYMFSNFVCKELENSKLAKAKRAKILNYVERLSGIKEDVWRYVYDVAQGQLWDMFEKAFNEERTTVKQKVFAYVIYSYWSPRPRKKEEDEASWIEMFSGLYPTVYQLISDIKKSLHEQCKSKGAVEELKKPQVVNIGNYKLVYTSKDTVMLPLMLMQLESKIFTEILRRLFNKRIVCFGIHDAVAVIHSKLPVDEVESVMTEVYADYGLIPTLSVDYYSHDE